ncbi:MAG: two-component regulator propeller domain-containing protein [Pirellulales bacterium]
MFGGADVREMIETSDGAVVCAVAPRSILVDGARQDLISLDSPDPNAAITTLCADGDGGLWVGTTNGLLHRTSRGERLWTTDDGMLDDHVLCLEQTRNGAVWVGTKGGVCRILGDECRTFGTRDGLSQNAVHAILEDREDNVWVGTKNGLNQFADRRVIPFTVNEGLPTNDVGPVLTDRDGTTWIGTFGHGLVRYDGKRFHKMTERDGLAGMTILCLTHGANKTLWLGGEHGLQALENGRVTATYTTEEGLPDDVVRCVCEDRQGVWIGTAKGLAPCKTDASRSSTTKNCAAARSPCWPRIDAAACWWRPRTTASFCRPTTGSARMPLGGMAPPVVDALYADVDGMVWIGTRGEGLRLFDGQNVVAFSIQDGLFDDDIYGIAADDQDRLWMACGKGIFRWREPRCVITRPVSIRRRCVANRTARPRRKRTIEGRPARSRS